MSLFIWSLLASCERKKIPSSVTNEIEELFIYVNQLAKKSPIEVVPQWVNGTPKKKSGDFEIVIKNHEENSGLEFVYPSGELYIPEKFIDLSAIENADLKKSNLIDYEYWKESLFLKPVKRDRLQNMSVEERSDYAEKMGFKASLMHARKWCYFSEGSSFKIILFIGNEGKLYGRIWNSIHETKDFSGKFFGDIGNTLIVIHRLSEGSLEK
jgi:hypothetical protein